jgi:hypothetical protein
MLQPCCGQQPCVAPLLLLYVCHACARAATAAHLEFQVIHVSNACDTVACSHVWCCHVIQHHKVSFLARLEATQLVIKIQRVRSAKSREVHAAQARDGVVLVWCWITPRSGRAACGGSSRARKKSIDDVEQHSQGQHQLWSLGQFRQACAGSLAVAVMTWCTAVKATTLCGMHGTCM